MAENERMTITDFLEARIADDEAVATQATGARWSVLRGVNASLVNIDARLVCDEKWKYGRFGHIATTSHDAAYAEHIAHYDPARVLAECAAKRAIIAECRPGTLDDLDVGEDDQPAPMWVARALAAVYKDHPDYRQEWATHAQ